MRKLCLWKFVDIFNRPILQAGLYEMAKTPLLEHQILRWGAGRLSNIKYKLT